MGKKPTGGENSKKAAGNAKKAEAANAKAAVQAGKEAAVEDEKWSKGAKSNAKKEEADAKKADAARRKAEKDALLAEEEKDARPTPKGSKTAQKKSRGLDLGQLDDPDNDPSSSSSKGKTSTALNASGIDNALDALTLTSSSATNDKVDRHPERRFKAAYAAYEARRMPEVEDERPGLRKQQRVDLIRKEFERSPKNPFNQVNARFDSTKDDMREIRDRERDKVEARLAE